MQLTLQYLGYSQNVLLSKIQTTKAYIEEQKRQIQTVAELKKKQRSKIKQYTSMIDKINEEALRYELLAKKACPSLMRREGDLIRELNEGNAATLLQKTSKGETIFQAFESHERKIVDAKKTMSNTPVIPPEKKENIQQNKEQKQEAEPDMEAEYLKGEFEESKDKIEEQKPKEYVKKPEENKNITINQIVDVSLPAKEIKKETNKEDSQKELLESSSNEDALISGMSLSYTASNVNFPASSGRVNYPLTVGQNSENVVSQRALLESGMRFSANCQVVPEEKGKDEDITEEIKDEKE